jgi:uncharacterized protein
MTMPPTSSRGGRRRKAGEPGPILVPVATLLREPSGTARSLSFDSIRIPGEDLPTQASSAAGTLRLTRTNRGIFAVGSFTTTIADSCARCLRDLEIPVELVVEEEILPSIDVATGAAVTDDETETARLSESHEIDLGALLADGLSLVAPIAPVCRPDCPGLCPVCGADLAGGPHAHADAEPDPRLGVLAGIRVDAEDETG